MVHFFSKEHFRRLASVGAIITISSLAVDTLAQNAVKFRHVPNVWNNSFSKVMATDVFNIYSPRRAGPFPTRDFRANVNFALTSMANLTMFDYYLWECDELADYCDFPRYQSLAVGTQCVKQEVKRDGSVVRHPSSNDTDFQLGLTDGLINSTTAVDYPTGPGFVDLGPLIFRWLILANPDTLKPLPTAMECAFYWTVNSYEGRAFNGTLSENITLTWTNITDRETIPHNITLTPPECLRDNSTIREDVYEDESGKEVAFTPDPCSNYVSAQGQRSLQSYFTDNEGGLIGSVSNDTRSDDTETYYNSSSLAMTSLLHYIWLANSTADIAGNVTEYADRLAWALTFSVRISLRGYRDDTYPFYFYGYTWGNDVYRPDTYYRISWGYLVLPIAFVISGSLFFAATVVLTWRDTKWKSSILAVVLHGLSPADLNTVGNVDGYADMREVGRSMQARLVSTELGKKLMSRDAIMDED